MPTQIELVTVFTEPLLRRCWLLNKALENAPLDEALRLARAADEFLSMAQVKAPVSLDGQAFTTALPDNPAPVPDQSFQFAAEAAFAAALRVDAGQAVDLISTTDEAEAGEFGNAADPENEGAEDPPDAGCAADMQDGSAYTDQQGAMTSGLAVLADIDDIIRYLRQQDDVVVSSGAGVYLVNARFQLNSEELLARANKIRQRQGKPQFERIPAGFPRANAREMSGADRI